MENIETGKANKVVVFYSVDDIGISGLPVKVDLYNETTSKWLTGTTWQVSKPAKNTMTDDGANFNGRYFFNWTPDVDGFYKAFVSCSAVGNPFENQESYYSESTLSNILAISGTINTINSKIDIIDTNLDTTLADVLAISATLNTVNGKVDIIDTNLDTTLVDVLAISGTLNTVHSKVDIIDTVVDTINSKIDIIDTNVDDIETNSLTIISGVDDVFTLVESFANIGSIPADVYSGGIAEDNVTIKDIDISNDVVYVVYKDASDKLKVVQTPFTQGVIIASGVN
jgi:outer membrane murein-binding lipoprotein Lpp